MCHKLDPRFFSDLAGLDPAEVCRNALCDFDAERGVYEIEAWNEKFEVDLKAAEIRLLPDRKPVVNIEVGLAIIFYLLRAQDKPLAGEWISEKDVPGGAAFFRGPHAVPSGLIAEKFGEDTKAFGKALRKMGGKPLDMADAAYVLKILPRVPVAVLFWPADSEFDAQCRILYDRTISHHLPIDVIFGLSEELCRRLSGKRPAGNWY